MTRSLFEAVFSESYLSPMRTVYVISDSQLEEIKRKQRKEELENLELSRKRLEENFQSRIKIIDEREHELQEELKQLAQVEKTNKIAAEGTEKCSLKP